MPRWTSTALIAALLVTAPAAAQRRHHRRPARPTPEPPPAQVDEPEPDAEPPPAVVPAPIAPPPGGLPQQQPPGQQVAPGAALQTGPGGEPPPGSNTPVPAYDPGPAPPDVTPIRSDYVTLMDDLVQARSRISALGTELFRTRVRVLLQDRTRGTQSMARMVVHLDGAPVFQSDGPVEGANDEREVFAGSVAPGPHVLTLEVDQRARDGDAYRYTLRDGYRFEVPRERLSEITIILEDGSNIARAFPAGGEGVYEVRTRMRVATRALPTQ